MALAAASTPSRRRSRSRSGPRLAPGGGAPRSCAQLKDWVLVRNGSRFWRDAVPALVSRVSESSVCLVLPNLLALRHGFGSARPFLELAGVSVRDIRPYVGADQAQLRATLLKAIRESRAASRTKPTGAFPTSEGARRSADGSRAAAVSAPGASADACRPDAAESSAEGGAGGARADVGAAAEDAGMCSEVEDAPSPTSSVDYQADSESDEPGRPGAPEPAGAAAPKEAATPRVATPQRDARRAVRPLQREDSEQKGVQAPAVAVVPTAAEKLPQAVEAVRDSTKAPVVAAAPAAAEKSPPPAPVAAKAVNFLELTRAISQAFRKRGGAAELSRQELEEDLGGVATSEELSQALRRLDEENKIFVSGDLVFLI